MVPPLFGIQQSELSNQHSAFPMRPLSILFAPFGSEGDVRPVLWLAGGLAARGHQITFIITPYYRHLVEARGGRVLEVGTAEDFAATLRDPRLWEPRHGSELVLDQMLKSLPRYADVLSQANTRFNLVIGTTLATGAFTWAEQNRIPRLMLHLQPLCLRSLEDCPLFLEKLEWLDRAPKLARRALFWLTDQILTRKMFPAINAHRARLGLPPLRRIDDDLWHGADAVAALFPDWFAASQPDWPRHVRQFGFPREIAPETPPPLPPELEQFLAVGQPPILWTHGSANLDTGKFAAVARAATAALGARGMLIGPATTEVPATENFLSVRPMPFAQIFPRCGAVAHHGGIGTAAQALAAGVPQLVVPRAHDQPDNARRLERLGVGARLRYDELTAPAAAQKLQALLAAPTTCAACAHWRKKILAENFLPALCAWAEEISRNRNKA
jgi:rhamnosyltransferase subunit B